MSEWGTNPVKAVELTQEEFSDLCNEVRRIGRDRKCAQGDTFNEIDYVCGAMAVMERLGLKCPAWPLLIMAGRSVVDEKE